MSYLADLPLGGLLFYSTDAPDADTIETAWLLLTLAEKERAQRFHFPRDRFRWIRGRAWIRQQLGRALSLSPHSLNLTAEPGGRLYLPDQPHFDFNLSHSGGWIMLGLCREGRIGVDLEIIDPTFPALEIAQEFFLPEEQAWLASGPIDRFFSLWTAKEALMKATGRGMSLVPNKILVSLREDLPSTVTNLEDGSCYPVTIVPSPSGSIAAVVFI